MSEGSGLSRLTLKFLEVFAAGLATAVSGYLIAHFTGYLAAVTPIAAVKQPWVIQQSVRSGPATPVVHQAAPAAAVPQSNTADQSPSANGTGAKSRDAARGAAAPSFEARVRAALAKAGPAHPASDDAPRREAVVPVDAMPRVSNTTTQPVDAPTGSIAAMPRPGDSAPRSVPVAPPPAAAAPAMEKPAMEKPAVENIAAPTPTIQLAPPSAVEIKSQPVASVDPNQPAPVAAQPPPSTDQAGPFAAIARRLHIDKLLTGGDQPPRPPMPVGQ